MIGNFSGRNTGDAAILGGLLKDLTARYGPLRYDVPTINPAFVRRQYPEYDVTPVGMLPWNLSVKIFGLPILRSILRSDLVLVTDAILFDRKLYNPLFNYLSTMALVLPMARRRGIPVVLYNVSLGPAATKAGKACLRRVLDAAGEIILRDEESLGEIPPDVELQAKIRRGADCALSIDPAPPERVAAILAAEDLQAGGRPYLTFNVNSYIDVFVRARGKRLGVAEFAALMSDTLNRLLAALDANIVMAVMQPMDMNITQKVLDGLPDKSRIRLVSNAQYSFSEMAGIYSRAELHVGMRTHSLILASSVGTPIVGVISTPKNRGYMRTIGQDARMIEFDALSPESLCERVLDTWAHREALRGELAPIIAAAKQNAAAAAEYLRPYLTGERAARQPAGSAATRHNAALGHAGAKSRPGKGIPRGGHEPERAD